jgi:uncharacterized membrane protein YqhA
MLERIFENGLWQSRFIVILAVIFGLVGAVVLFVVASMDIILDVSESVTPENINDILEEAWEYINYRINGNKVPSNGNDTFVKEIKPMKLKRIV